MSDNQQLNAALNFGLMINNLICDGQIHRVSTQLKPKGKNGWYIAFADSPILVMGDWQTGVTETWRQEGYKQSHQERIKVQQAIKAAGEQRAKTHALAAKQARELYSKAQPVNTHPYLTDKAISAVSNIRVKGNLLVVPLIDYSLTKPALVNVQTINEQGFKKFTKGGRVTGLCCPIELPIDEPLKRIYLVEGFATAVSVHQITGYPVLAAMNANNLAPVAKIVRQCWPDVDMVIAGDDDYLTEQKTGVNIGKDKALIAAANVRAKTAFPPFTIAQKLNGLTDWNDYERNRHTRVTS